MVASHDPRISSFLSRFEPRLEEQAKLAREVERLKGFVSLSGPNRNVFDRTANTDDDGKVDRSLNPCLI